MGRDNSRSLSYSTLVVKPLVQHLFQLRRKQLPPPPVEIIDEFQMWCRIPTDFPTASQVELVEGERGPTGGQLPGRPPAWPARSQVDVTPSALPPKIILLWCGGEAEWGRAMLAALLDGPEALNKSTVFTALPRLWGLVNGLEGCAEAGDLR